MIDDRTQHRNLPLPHADNRMQGEDLPRLREALGLVDGELHQLDQGLANHHHDSAYAAVGHDHAGIYAGASHHHDSAYAAVSHDHAGIYAGASHHHDSAYAAVSHDHAGVYAGTSHHHDSAYAAVAHVSDANNPHGVSKSQVGLGNVANLKVKLDATVAPGVNDDSGQGYGVGSRWVDTTAGKEYVCVAATAGAAVWKETSQLVTGKHTLWIPATAMTPRATNGPGSGTVETTTNKVNVTSLDFDATTAEYVQFPVAFNKGWNLGTVTFKAYWTHGSTTTNFGVAWTLAGVALSDDDAADTAFGSTVTVTDTGGTTQDIYVTAESAAVTIAGSPATGDVVWFQVGRDPANASDTMAIDAKLIGVQVKYTLNAATDD